MLNELVTGLITVVFDLGIISDYCIDLCFSILTLSIVSSVSGLTSKILVGAAGASLSMGIEIASIDYCDT